MEKLEIVFYNPDDVEMFEIFMMKAGRPACISEPLKSIPFTLFKIELDRPNDAFQLGVEWSLFREAHRQLKNK